MKQDKKTIVIIHYNTPFLTECLIKSINKYVPNCEIYIFDNSDTQPFTYTQNNLTLLDNTNGQIINFDEWLKNYPNRDKSPGSSNKWGSAKHTISIQKCIEILDKNFLLLDSDVLIKQDISIFFDNNYLYIGESAFQPNSKIKRVLPFICYLNVEMLKSNGLTYFNDNYMHGLCNGGDSDKYDTGGALYVASRSYKIKEVKIGDYITHYKGGSWEDIHNKRYGKTISSLEWLESNKQYWSDNKNKNVIYTCITGNYDILLEPLVLSEGFDYICFTDNKELKSNVWKIRPIPEWVDKALSNVKQQRCLKVNAHKLFPEYDLSIWVDGSIEIIGDVNNLIKVKCTSDAPLFIPQHPMRICTYREGEECIKLKKDTSENINKQLDIYRAEGFPKNFGMVQSNIMVRKHNNKDCIRLMETWWDEIKKYSHRDQLSFNYSLWKNPDVKIVLFDKKICNSDYFYWWSGHTGKIKKKTSHNPFIFTLNPQTKQLIPKEDESAKTSIKEEEDKRSQNVRIVKIDRISTVIRKQDTNIKKPENTLKQKMNHNPLW